MSWNMLNNGVCPPEPLPLHFIKSGSNLQNHALLDNYGRIYTWGTSSYTYTGQTPVASGINYAPNPALIYPGINGWQMQFPYQVGTKNNYVDVQVGERTFYALDSDGYLYAWGEAKDSQGGWADGTQYNSLATGGASNVMTPGGNVAIFPTLVNNTQWSSFAGGDYHVLALGLDKRVYVWGANLNSAFGMASPAESLTPILVSTLPNENFKLISASYNGSLAVTENNVIYFWGRSDYAITTSPTILPLAIPAGVTIIQAVHGGGGIAILLSNGDMYCTYDRLNFTTTDENLALIPGGHFFVFIDTFSTGAAAIDNDGALWGWGNLAYLVSRNDAYCDQNVLGPGFEPVIITDTVGWEYCSIGANSHIAINNEGKVFTWGSNDVGMLGVGQGAAALGYSCSVLQVVGPKLDSGILAYESASVPALQYVINSPEQLSEHNPCGHWHRRLRLDANESGTATCNCWNFGLAISGTNVLFVSCGIYMPHQCVFFRYDIATRIWFGPFYEVSNFTAAGNITGASTSGAWDVAVSYGGDSSGSKFDPVITNRRARLISVYHPTGEINTINFPSAVQQDFDGQIVNDDGDNICLVLVRTSSNTYVLYHGGKTGSFATANTFTEVSGISRAKIVQGNNIYYVGVFSGGGNLVRLHTSSDGLSWTEKAIIPLASGTNDFDLSADGNSVYITTRDAHFYYSHNRGDSFSDKLIRAPCSYMAASETSRAALFFYNDTIERVPNYETMEDVLEVVPDEAYKLTFFTVLCSSGDFVTYMRDNLFVESRIVLPISQDMGLTWEIIPSPLDHFKDQMSALAGPDDPRWKFEQQVEKFRLDPEYV